MAYAQSDTVAANVDSILAAQYNNLRAELKAAAHGMLLGSVCVLTFAYNGDGTINTVTSVDAENDANLDLDYVATYGYTDGKITTITTVFSKLGITLTETLSYTGYVLDTVTPAFS